jgi:NCS1 family nucleobase:cation symporter-1
LIPATLMGVAITFTPFLQPMANFAWFTGCFLGGVLYFALARRQSVLQLNTSLNAAGQA